jgi:DNA-binding transcriptional MerR regulator
VAGMAGDTLLTIGELARLTGLPVKTIRFWSDEGLVPPADRTPAGYRRYGSEAQLRLGLVRTLRDLGIDLATIKQVLERQVTITEVAEVHAAALEVRIRALRLHRAVLRTVAGRGTATPEEIELMHKLAQLSDAERRRLITDFIDDTFSGLDLGPDFLPMLRAAMPELPDEPTQEQLDAWVELAELVQDADFRASVRRAAIEQARAVAEVGRPSVEDHQALATLLRERVAAATAAGVEPGTAEARPVVDELAAAYARHAGRADGPEFRSWLRELLESSSDRRYERYWQLLGVINGWPAAPSVTPAAEWLTAALRSD